jgi:hypothetical protein
MRQLQTQSQAISWSGEPVGTSMTLAMRRGDLETYAAWRVVDPAKGQP